MAKTTSAVRKTKSDPQTKVVPGVPGNPDSGTFQGVNSLITTLSNLFTDFEWIGELTIDGGYWDKNSILLFEPKTMLIEPYEGDLDVFLDGGDDLQELFDSLGVVDNNLPEKYVVGIHNKGLKVFLSDIFSIQRMHGGSTQVYTLYQAKLKDMLPPLTIKVRVDDSGVSICLREGKLVPCYKQAKPLSGGEIKWKEFTFRDQTTKK